MVVTVRSVRDTGQCPLEARIPLMLLGRLTDDTEEETGANDREEADDAENHLHEYQQDGEHLRCVYTLHPSQYILAEPKVDKCNLCLNFRSLRKLAAPFALLSWPLRDPLPTLSLFPPSLPGACYKLSRLDTSLGRRTPSTLPRE